MEFKALRVMEKGAKAQFESLTPRPLVDREVRVQLEYSCLNYKDALAVTGSSPIMRNLPCTAGIDLAGVVSESTDQGFQVGQKVLACGANLGELFDGGLAEQAVVAADALVALPDDFSTREAMIYGTAGFTAALAMVKLLQNQQSPEHGPIAVTGASGGVGSFSIALLAQAGFSATAITRKTNEADYLQSLGASAIVDANECGKPEGALMKMSWGGAIDSLGGDMLAWLLATTKFHGNVASIGLASSYKLNTTVMPFILRGVNLLGVHSVDIPSALRQNTWQHIFNDWRLAQPERMLQETIALSEVPQACEHIMAAKVRGRYLVKIAD
ncbi:MAG: YhdH/YhfP family quinone oxidoreductase [Oceanococcus sp.]